MKSNSFPYAFWLKVIGLFILILRVIIVLFNYLDDGFLDLNDLALGICLGLFFIFFSKEKVDDEMVHALKFKALTTAVIVGFALTHLYNYIFLNWGFKQGQDLVQSISAYQFLALTLLIATAMFYILRYKSTHPKPE